MQYVQFFDRNLPYVLAVLRIVTGLIFMEHGTQKLFGFPAPSERGMPELFSLSGIGGIMEFVGGLLIAVGSPLCVRGSRCMEHRQCALAS